MASLSERLRTVDPDTQLQDERWRTAANAGGWCARELQNRWAAFWRCCRTDRSGRAPANR